VFNKKGRTSLIVIIVLAVAVLVSVIFYFLFDENNGEKGKTLPIDVCVYDNGKYLTCGTAFVLVLEGVESSLVANEPFYFPQGENNLIGLVDKTKPEGEGAFLLFLEEGEHTINEETSRRAVGSFVAR